MEEKREIIYSDLSSASRKQPYDAMVYIEGDQVIAIDSDGKIIDKGTAGTDDTRVIQAAINSIAGGGDLLIKPGEYVITDVIELTGLQNIRICGCNGTHLNQNYSGPAASWNVHTLKLTECSNVEIRNIKFSESNLHQNSHIIRIYGSDRIIIEDCVFDGCVGAIQTRGINEKLKKCTNVTIRNNLIENYRYDGVSVDNGSEYITISGNTLRNGYPLEGVDLLYGIGTVTIGAHCRDIPKCSHLLIDGNVIQNQARHDAIDSHGGDFITVSNNIISSIPGIVETGHGSETYRTDSRGINLHINAHGYSPPPPAEVLSCTGWIISGNTIIDVNYGISVGQDNKGSTLSNVVISDNAISDICGRGINVGASDESGPGTTYHASNISIANNVVRKHIGEYSAGYGIVSGNWTRPVFYTNVTIFGNTIDCSEDQVPFQHGIIAPNGENICVSSNTITGVATDGIYVAEYSVSGIDMPNNRATVCGNLISNITGTTGETTIGIAIADYRKGYNQIFGNTVDDCMRGISYASFVDGTNTIIEDNILKTHQYPIHYYPGKRPLRISRNIGYVTENSGMATITGADNGSIPHGCAETPTKVILTSKTAGRIVAATDVGTTNITVAIKDPDISNWEGESTTIYWRAEV